VASYRLLIKPSAGKELEALPKQDRRRIVSKITSLSLDARPPGCEKLSGHDQYRLRQGNYRILYEIQDRDLIVVVVKVGHRREVYR
jgi:mRNA interferase RelE/StbE